METSLALCKEKKSSAISFVRFIAMCYIVGYFAAIFLDLYGFKVFKRISILVVVFAFLANALRIVCKYFLEIKLPKFDFFEAYCHALLGVALVLFVIIYAKRIKPCKLFNFSDKYSYYI